MYGWTGKILKVDLNSGTISDIATSNYVPKLIGGRGVSAMLYWEMVSPKCGAFDPENALIMMTGPANGTLAPAATRMTIAHKSPVPLKECYGYSNPGGHFGAELKFAGYDGLVIQGKSPYPVYLWINDGRVEIRQARRLWGMTVSKIMQEFQYLHGPEMRVACIGPAGENLCRSAAIIIEWEHATGTTGAGAVMGSKNLKAIVVKGTGAVEVARPKELLDLWYHYFRLLNRKPGDKEYPAINKSLAYYTYHHTHLFQMPGRPPCPNPEIYFKNNGLDDPFCTLKEAIDKGSIKIKWGGCYACPVNCSLVYQSRDAEIPSGSGQCCDMFSWAAHEWAHYKRITGVSSIWASYICNDLGLSNTNTAGFELSWFLQLVELGVFNEQNTGLPVNEPWTFEFIKGFLEKVAYRKGEFFDAIAEGQERFLKQFSDENVKAKKIYNWHITKSEGFYLDWKGSEYITPTTRAILGAVASRYDQNRLMGGFGKSGIDRAGLTPERLRNVLKYFALKNLGSETAVDIPGEPKTWKDKVPAAIILQNLGVHVDCVTMCIYANCPPFFTRYTPDYLGDTSMGAKIYSAVTGIDMTHDEMMAAMNVIVNIERCIHVREGRRREHDTFNDSIFQQEGWKWTSKQEFNRVMDDYYRLRGWDIVTGIPTRSMLEKLGLKRIADEMETEYGVPIPSEVSI